MACPMLDKDQKLMETRVMSAGPDDESEAEGEVAVVFRPARGSSRQSNRNRRRGAALMR
jgi:hypothetical protein